MTQRCLWMYKYWSVAPYSFEPPDGTSFVIPIWLYLINTSRCSEGLQGLREQGITNTIVRHFIDEYERLFCDKDMMETEMEQPRRGSSDSSRRIQVQAARSERSPPLLKRKGIRRVILVCKQELENEGGLKQQQQSKGNKKSENQHPVFYMFLYKIPWHSTNVYAMESFSLTFSWNLLLSFLS